MNPLRAKRYYLKQENAKYGPILTEVPRSEWSPEARSAPAQPERVWRNRHFLVHFWPEPDCAGRLSIQRTEINSDGGWKDGIAWDDIQRLKLEAGFGDKWAVEFFPADASVVNVANLRHIWLLNEPLAFGWHMEAPHA